MAEILAWKFDYTPIENKWTVINCEKYQDVLNFLRPQSIILISREEYDEKQNYLFFQLVKLSFNQCEIIFVDELASQQIDDKINFFIRRKFETNDKVEELETTFRNLSKLL